MTPEQHEQHLEDLTAIYWRFLDEQDLNREASAEELLHEDLTPAQRQWTSAFLRLWEATDELAS